MVKPGADEPPAHTGLRDRSAFAFVVSGTFGLQALIMVAGILSARLLGVQGRGEVALVFALSLAASQISFGGSLPNAIAKELAERRLAARDGLRSIPRRHLLWLALPAGAAAVLLAAVENSSDGWGRAGLAAAVFVMTVQTIASRLLIGSLQGEVGHLGRMAAVALVPQVLATGVMALALAAGWSWGTFEVLTAYLVTGMIGLVAAYVALARPTGRPDDELDPAVLFRTARHAYLSSVRPIDSVGLDRIMVGAQMGTAPLGLYSAATAVSSLCRIVGNAVCVIVLPRVAAHQDDPPTERAVVRRWLLLSAAIITVVVIGVEAVTSPAIRLAFGSQFSDAIPAARWLVLADGLFGFRSVLIAVLQGRGRSAAASWVELALTPVMVLGVVVSAASWGLTGIGVTMAVLGALGCVALGRLVAKPARPPRRRQERRSEATVRPAPLTASPVGESGTD